MKYVEDILKMDNICESNDEIWFVDREENALYRYNKISEIANLELFLPNDCSLEDMQRKKTRNTPYCFEVRDLLFCLPDRGNKIIVVNRNTKELNTIEVPNAGNIRLTMHLAWIIDNNLWVYSYGLGKIFVINTINLTLIEEHSPFEGKRKVGFESVLVENKLYFVARDSNEICELDVKDGFQKVISLTEIEEGLFTILFHQDKFWMSGISGKIYVWDKKTGIVRSIEDYPRELQVFNCIKDNEKGSLFPKQEGNVPVFYKSFISNDKVCFLPYNWSEAACQFLMYVSAKTYDVYIVDLLKNAKSRLGTFNVLKIKDDEKILLYTSQYDYIQEVDLHSQEIKEVYIKIDVDSLVPVIRRAISQECKFLNEKKGFLVRLFKCMEELNTKMDSKDERGSLIWKTLN